MTEETHKAPFSPRNVNVLKITTLVDAEILLRECDFALASIQEQQKAPFFASDSEWIRDSKRAEIAIIHKRELCLMKLTDLQKKEAAKTPEDAFKARFVKAAQQILPSESFEQIKSLAMSFRAA